MPKKIAIIKGGVVVNVGRFPDDYNAEEGEIDITELHVGPGWKYDGVVFSEPDPSIVIEVPKARGVPQLTKVGLTYVVPVEE